MAISKRATYGEPKKSREIREGILGEISHCLRQLQRAELADAPARRKTESGLLLQDDQARTIRPGSDRINPR